MIPYINTTNPSIPNVGIGGIRNVNVYMANVRDLNISDTRVWMNEPPSSVPPDVPVVVNIGKPIVDMPGCVTVHKENVKQRSKNKMLVNDDPKGNTTLCDSGMPSYQPVDYQSQGLTWTTVVPLVGGISGDGVVKSGSGGGSLFIPSGSGSSGTTVVHVSPWD